MPTDIYKQTSLYMFKKFDSMQSTKTDEYVQYSEPYVDNKSASAPDMLVRTVSELHKLSLAPKQAINTSNVSTARELSTYMDNDFCKLFEGAIDTERIPSWSIGDKIRSSVTIS